MTTSPRRSASPMPHGPSAGLRAAQEAMRAGTCRAIAAPMAASWAVAAPGAQDRDDGPTLAVLLVFVLLLVLVLLP